MRERADSDAELPLAAGLEAVLPAPDGVRRRETIEGAPAGTVHETADGSGGAPELRNLLKCYARLLERMDGLSVVVWRSGFPAPRALVRTLALRHVIRSVAALKRGACRQVAIADDPAAASRNLKIIEHFEQSLSKAPRLAAIATMALIGTLLVAYVLGHYWMQTPSSQLLGDLTSAAFELDRSAALDAFKKHHLPGSFYVGGAVVIVWSVALVTLPLLPAFSVKRQLLQAFSGAEARGFAALGARRVYDAELDLLAQLLLVALVAVFGINGAIYNARLPGDGVAVILGTIDLVSFGLAALATAELYGRYTLRRGASANPWDGAWTRFTVRLVCGWSLVILLLTFFLHR